MSGRGNPDFRQGIGSALFFLLSHHNLKSLIRSCARHEFRAKSMEQSKIDMFAMANKENFTAQQWVIINNKLESLPNEKSNNVMTTTFRNPTTMLIISLFLGQYGIDRFMLGETGLGILKLLTCGGCGIWTIIDWFSIQQKTKDYNFNKFNESLIMF